MLPLIDEFLEALQSPGESALDEVVRAELGARVRSVVGSLPPEQRMVIVLRYTQGLSYDEIAGILGIPVGTVKWRVAEARRLITARLGS